MSMDSQQPKPTPQPAQPQHAPMAPQPAARQAERTAQPAARPRTSAVTPKRVGLFVAAAAVIGLAIAAVGTGMVHVPGFDAGGTQAISVASNAGNQTAQVNDEKARIGVMWRDLSPAVIKSMNLTTNQPAGIVVTKIFANTPAEQAGFQVGDIILSVDGVPVSGTGQLTMKIEYTPLDQHINMVYERAGTLHNASVGVAKWCTTDVKNADFCRNP